MQDDEYLAALQADREKELLAMEEARQKEEEAQKKLDQEQVIVIFIVDWNLSFFFLVLTNFFLKFFCRKLRGS